MIFEGDIFSKSVLICILIAIFSLFYLVIKTIAFITTSYLLGVLVIILFLRWVLRTVGLFAMYPGSFALVKSDIQIKVTMQMFNKLQSITEEIYKFTSIVHNKALMQARNYRVPQFPPLIEFTHQMINTYALFQNRLSKKKQEMLELYRKIIQRVEAKEIRERSLEDIVRNHEFSQLTEDQWADLGAICGELIHTLNSILAITSTFLGPLTEQSPSSFQIFKYKLRAEKLYEIRFAYRSWKKHFQYSMYIINTPDNHELQCAVIHSYRGQNNNNQQAVLICNPNGAYLQYFALESEYINFYLDKGYKIILWNYRGYGCSTGSPSISRSISDVKIIYNYAMHELHLHPVIVHGYSIGGSPAINLAKEESEKIKLLIADRTFNSIDDVNSYYIEMSEMIGKGLKSLTKILFYFDCFDMGKIYSKVKCNKLIIWDSMDEVISDASSLKRRVLMNYLQNHNDLESIHIERDDSDEQNTLSKNSSHIFSDTKEKHTFKQELIEKFVKAIINILHEPAQAHSQMIDEGMEELQIFNIKEGLIEHLGPLDGAGTFFFTEDVLGYAENGNHDKLKQIAQMFLSGLAYYGCYLPLQHGSHQYSQLKNRSAMRIKRATSKLKKQNRIPVDKASQLLLIIDILQSIGQRLSVCSNENLLSHPQLGILLPTNVGHNAELTAMEMNFMSEVVRVSCE